MNKVINGKRYDTKKARLIGERSEGQGWTDFSYWFENLYQKKTGEFFLHCGGGPNSKYGYSDGNRFGSDEKIEPLTIDEAKKWCEILLDADEYEDIFGDLEETDENCQQYSFLCPVSILDNLKKKKNETNITVTELIIKALRKSGY